MIRPSGHLFIDAFSRGFEFGFEGLINPFWLLICTGEILSQNFEVIRGMFPIWTIALCWTSDECINGEIDAYVTHSDEVHRLIETWWHDAHLHRKAESRVYCHPPGKPFTHTYIKLFSFHYALKLHAEVFEIRLHCFCIVVS